MAWSPSSLFMMDHWVCETISELSLLVNRVGKRTIGRQSWWLVRQWSLHFDTGISYLSNESACIQAKG